MIHVHLHLQKLLELSKYELSRCHRYRRCQNENRQLGLDKLFTQTAGLRYLLPLLGDPIPETPAHREAFDLPSLLNTDIYESSALSHSSYFLLHMMFSQMI